MKIDCKKIGISLIVLVITVIITYDELIKIDKIPPENKMKIINEYKVVSCKITTFNNIVRRLLGKNEKVIRIDSKNTYMI